MRISQVMIYINIPYIMEPAMKVAKWGNSLAIRLSKPIVELLKIKEGDDLQFTVSEAGGVTLCQQMDRRAWLESLRQYRGLIPADFKFDRDEANARD